MANTVKNTKKKGRRLKRSVRKTLGTLLLISALIVAAIPVDGLQAKSPGPTDWGTLKENMPDAANVPTVEDDETIYTTGDNKYQFAYVPDGSDVAAVILGYSGGELSGGTLVIPNTIDYVYRQLSDNEGTGRGYVAVGKKGNFLFYRVVEMKDKLDANGQPVKRPDGTTEQEEVPGTERFLPCYYDDESKWSTLDASEYYYYPNYPDKNGGPQKTTSADYQRIKDIQVRYIGNQYLKTGAGGSGTWAVDGTVDYAHRDKGVFAQNGTNITTLQVGSSMRGIGDYAFYNCTNLAGITLNDGLTTIGVGAFANCYNMTSVDLAVNASIGVIGDYAFYNCMALKRFIVPNNVREIGDSVFEGCTELTQVELCGENRNVALAKVGTNVFRNCAKLESLTFPPHATFEQEIDVAMFDGCISLEYIEAAQIYDKVNFIGDFEKFKSTVPPTFYFKGLKNSQVHQTATNNNIAYSFYDDASGQYVYELTVFEDGKKAVCWVDGTGRLINCDMDDGMNTITLPTIIGPYNVKAIGAATFQDNCFLEKITIPAEMESIEANAFRGCHNLENVIFTDPAKLTMIGAGAFKTQQTQSGHTSCPAEGGVSGGDTYVPVEHPVLNFVGPISNECEPFKYAMDPNENINIGGQEVTYITYYSGWPTNLAVQYDPDTDKNTLIDYPTLLGIASGEYTSEKYAYITEEYEKAASIAAQKYYAGGWGSLTEDEANIVAAAMNIVLPDGIEAIGTREVDGETYGLFEYKEDKEEYSTQQPGGGELRKTIKAEGIQEVAENAFKGSKYLTEITFSDNTVSIGAHAFEDCVLLEKANLPATVSTMGLSPFRGCDVMTEVDFGGSTYFTCKDSIIYELDGNGEPAKLVEYLSGKRPRIVMSSEVEGITEIYPEAFMGSNVESVDLSGSRIPAVPVSAFQDTGALYMVTLPDSCRSIAKDAFSDSSIRQLQIPNSVSVINEKAFDDTNNDGATDKSSLTFVCVEGSVAEIYANDNGIQVRYKLPTYTVKFYDPDLNVVDTQFIEEGSPFTKPEVESLPDMVGYTRLTWTPPVGTIVTSDLNVYAKYENLDPSEFQKTVNFYAFDKEEILSTQSVTPGENAVPPVPPNVDGYAFTGWWPEDMKITDETDNPYNVYAQYEKIDSSDKMHTVTFYDHENSVVLTLRVEDGKDAQIPSSLTQSMQNRAGYTFTGWKPLPVNVTEDMDVYAQYTENSTSSSSPSPSPSNNPNGGSDITGSGNSGSSNSVGVPHTLTVRNGSGSGTYRPGRQIIIVANEPPAGQEFSGWTVSPASTVVTDKSMSAAIITMPNNDVAVIANYKKKESSGNGSSSGSGTGSGGDNRPGSGSGTVTGGGGTTVVIDKNGLSNTGVVSATVNGSSDSFTIKITESSAATEAVLRALMAEYGSVDNIKYFPMDISLYDSTGTTEITDTTGLSISITLPLPDSLIPYAGNNKAAGVVNDRLDKLTPRFGTINGVSCITFTAEHFSPYVIYVDVTDLSAGGTTDATPKTGDGIHPKWFLSIGLACLSFVLFMQKDGSQKGRKKQKVKVRV